MTESIPGDHFPLFSRATMVEMSSSMRQEQLVLTVCVHKYLFNWKDKINCWKEIQSQLLSLRIQRPSGQHLKSTKKDLQETDSVFVTVLNTENNVQKPKHFQTFPICPNATKQEEISPCFQMTVLYLKRGMKQGEENETQDIGKYLI